MVSKTVLVMSCSLLFLAVPEIAVSKSSVHAWRVAQNHTISATAPTGSLSAPPSQLAELQRPPLAQDSFTQIRESNPVTAVDPYSEDTPGGGLWMQVAAGCGLLLFGAIRRLAGL
jgi:hypothetical protein